MSVNSSKKSTDGSVVPPAHRAAYSRIVNLLASNGVIAKHLGQLLDRGQQEGFAKVLFELTRRANTSLRVVRELLDLEFARKVGGEENTILRENSLCTKFITVYSLHEAAIYLKLAFSPLVVDIISTEDDLVDEQWYLDRVDHIFSAIREDEMIDRMPRSVRAIVASILEMSERYVPERRYPLMAGYLFLRLYNPCLSSPAQFGMVNDSMISPTARQRLLVITKALQHLSNNTTPKDNIKLGKWIEDMQPEMEAFLDIICMDDFDPPFCDQLEMGRSLSLDELDRDTLTEVVAILQENRTGLEAVRKRLAQADPGGELVSLYDELIRDLDALGPVERLKPSDAPRSPREGQAGGAVSSPTLKGSVSVLATPVIMDDSSGSSSSNKPSSRSPRNRIDPSSEPRDSGRAAATSMGAGLDAAAAAAGGKQNMRNKVKGLFSSKEKDKDKEKLEKERAALLERQKSGSDLGQDAKQTALLLAGLSEAFAANIPGDGLTACTNVTFFCLLRGYVSSQTLVAKGMEFVASMAVGWLESTLSLAWRKTGLSACQRWEALGLVIRAEAAPEGLGIQDDDSLYKVVSWRYKVWDALVGKKWSSEHDAFCAQVTSLCQSLALEGVIPSDGGRAQGSAAAVRTGPGPREGELLAWGTTLMSHADFGLHGKQSSKVGIEWLRLWGNFGAVQAIEFLAALSRNQRALPVYPSELRDQNMDDVCLVLQVVSTACGSQRGGRRAPKAWDRDSMIALLSGVDLLSDGSFASTKDLGELSDNSVFLVEGIGFADQACRYSDWSAPVQSFAGKGSGKPPAYWMGLWKRLEQCEFLKRKAVLQLSSPRSLLNSVCWLVTTAGQEFLLDRDAYIYPSFTLDASSSSPSQIGSGALPIASASSGSKGKPLPVSPGAAGTESSDPELVKSGSKSYFGRTGRGASSTAMGESRKVARRSIEAEWRESSDGTPFSGDTSPLPAATEALEEDSKKGLPKLLGRMKKGGVAVQNRGGVAQQPVERSSSAKSAPGPLKAIDVLQGEPEEVEVLDKKTRALRSPATRERQGSDVEMRVSNGTPSSARRRNGSESGQQQQQQVLQRRPSDGEVEDVDPRQRSGRLPHSPNPASPVAPKKGTK